MQIIISFWNKSLLWTIMPPNIYIHNLIGWNSSFILHYHLVPTCIFFSCILAVPNLQYHTCSTKLSLCRTSRFVFLLFSINLSISIGRAFAPSRLCSSAASALSDETCFYLLLINISTKSQFPGKQEIKCCFLEPAFLLLKADLTTRGISKRVVKLLYSKVFILNLTRTSSMDHIKIQTVSFPELPSSSLRALLNI